METSLHQYKMKNLPANYRNELFRLFMRKRYGEMAVLFLIMIALYVAAPYLGAEQGAANAVAENGSFYQVVRVVDGDTLVYDKNGQDVTVRMVGIDTPETVDPRRPVGCFGKEASAESKRLMEGQKVRIEKDALGDTIDKYQRELRNVYLADGTMVNQLLVAEGYATVTRGYQFSQKENFIKLEEKARLEGKGLWNSEICPNN